MWHKFIIILFISATWLSPGRALLRWDGPGCVYRNQVLIACDARNVSHLMALGGPLTDGALRPAAGDVYTLVRPDGQQETTPLRSVVYMPAFL